MLLFLVIQTVEILLGSTLKPCLRPAIYTGQFLTSDLLSIQVILLPPICYLFRSVFASDLLSIQMSFLPRPAIYTCHFFASNLLSIQVSFCLRPLLKQVSFLRPQTCSLPVILNIASDLLFMQALNPASDLL